MAICYSSPGNRIHPLKSIPSSWVEGKSIPPIDQANSHSSHSIHQQCQSSNTSQIWQCLTTCTAATHSGHHQFFPGSNKKPPNWPPHCHPRAATVHSPHSHWNAFLKPESRWSHSAQPSYNPRINSKLDVYSSQTLVVLPAHLLELIPVSILRSAPATLTSYGQRPSVWLPSHPLSLLYLSSERWPPLPSSGFFCMCLCIVDLPP